MKCLSKYYERNYFGIPWRKSDCPGVCGVICVVKTFLHIDPGHTDGGSYSGTLTAGVNP